MATFLKDQATYSGEIDEFVSRRYQVVVRLSVGGTAEIYQAIDTNNDAKVVIKILPSHHSSENEKWEDDARGKTLDISHRVIEKSAEFLIQEANFLKNCRHPNIIRLHDYDLEAKRPYIVLDYLGKTTLEKEIINSSRNFSLKSTLGILKHMCAALGYVHKKGFVYCDIKPSNIISSNKKYTLIDFGLVRPIGMAVSGGTIGYMPPEVLQSDSGQVPAGPTIDIYSLGVLLYELLTGYHPLSHQNIREFNKHHSFDTQSTKNSPPNPASDLNAFLPKAIDEILLKCIDNNPQYRYQDMDVLLQDFTKAGSGTI